MAQLIGNAELLKKLNNAAIYTAIDNKGPISRIQLAEETALAPASITKIVRHLIDLNVIKEVEQQASTGGRRATSLMIDSKTHLILAVRIGRGHVYLSLYNLIGEKLDAVTQSIVPESIHELVEHVFIAIDALIEKYTNICTIGITMPGLVDPDRGVVTHFPRLDLSAGPLPLVEMIQERYQRSCFIGNDIRGLALAEHFLGASQNCDDSILVSVDQGTGAGIIVNGKVLLGKNQHIGEIGHIQVDPLGKPCQCGNFGCLETIVSAPAMLALVEERLEQGYESQLQEIDSINMQHLCDAALQGDTLALEVVKHSAIQLGRALAISVNLFTPEKILLSGVYFSAFELIEPILKNAIKNQSIGRLQSSIPIELASFSSDPTIASYAIVKRSLLEGDLLQYLEDRKTH